MKHADASAVTLQGWQHDERLMLVIEDDGSGLPPDSGQHGFGLTGMRERVTALGGTLTISCLHRHACQRFYLNVMSKVR